jgi:hypothetical protein
MAYTITLDGLGLHYYGGGVYGWGAYSSTTGAPGKPVLFEMRSEAEDWMQARHVFCAGALIDWA